MIRTAIAFVTIIGAATGVLDAQRPSELLLEVGDPQIQVSRIPVRVDTFAILAEEPRDFELGSMITRTIIDPSTEPATLIRVRHIYLGVRHIDLGRPGYGERQGTHSDSMVLDYATLAPQFASSKRNLWSLSLSFTEGYVSGESSSIQLPGRSRSLYVLEAPVFYEGAIDVLLQSLSLRPGLTIEVPVLGVRRREESPSVLLRVVGAERLVLEDGTHCSTWRVEVKGAREPLVGTYWIDQRSRALLQIRPTEQGRYVRRSGCGE